MQNALRAQLLKSANEMEKMSRVRSLAADLTAAQKEMQAGFDAKDAMRVAQGFRASKKALDKLRFVLGVEKRAENEPTNPSLWSKAKSKARAKFDVYPCVPLDSKALTREGWKSYEELSIGDQILTYSIDRDELEWGAIRDLHHYPQADLITMGKATGFKVRCTPNHKWVVRRETRRGGSDILLPAELIEAQSLNKKSRIITCAKLNTGHELLLEDFSKYDSTWTQKVIAMSPAQRVAFLASAIVYDGWDHGPSTKIAGRHTFGFKQKDKDHLEATLLAAFLSGYHVTFRPDKSNLDITSATLIRGKSSHRTQNLLRERAEQEEVWCPTTDNHTWVMKQNGFITITGNSAYANGWASKWYKSQGGGWRKKKKKKKSKKKAFFEVVADLRKWFKEDWVDISRKDKDGKHPECGRDDASKGAYPKCRPKAKAKQMSKKDKESASRRKRSVENKKKPKSKGRKPNYVSTKPKGKS